MQRYVGNDGSAFIDPTGLTPINIAHPTAPSDLTYEQTMQKMQEAQRWSIINSLAGIEIEKEFQEEMATERALRNRLDATFMMMMSKQRAMLDVKKAGLTAKYWTLMKAQGANLFKIESKLAAEVAGRKSEIEWQQAQKALQQHKN